VGEEVSKPLLLDLFCGAGGCTKGYQRAGFYVVGVDIKPQKNYCGDEFYQADAMDFLRRIVSGDIISLSLFSTYTLDSFDVIVASPPCQSYCALKHLYPLRQYPQLVEETRALLQASGKVYVIENVPGAPLLNPAVLCGSAFNLRVRRHRLFESNLSLPSTRCRHAAQGQVITVCGTGGRRVRRRAGDNGGATNMPRTVEEAQEAMGIDWMTRKELSQSIPPAYTEFIGAFLMQHITVPA
jgi:DNA (cytosine-5)-methyltransferase 1